MSFSALKKRHPEGLSLYTCQRTTGQAFVRICESVQQQRPFPTLAWHSQCGRNRFGRRSNIPPSPSANLFKLNCSWTEEAGRAVEKPFFCLPNPPISLSSLCFRWDLTLYSSSAEKFRCLPRAETQLGTSSGECGTLELISGPQREPPDAVCWESVESVSGVAKK